ncbi:hypothetical protein BS47DRAFT_1361874 [Hydnum rufescens UP504]|uniref:Uncharacterized protein n=1 Tax=Hydnum rufescens UP504 TaxID=1448309 RepID=A0A9P6AYM4_9AGAM|nr:hypothetical protein BS47DRAFT_1361874 [Hydnum rufescens UP504]
MGCEVCALIPHPVQGNGICCFICLFGSHSFYAFQVQRLTDRWMIPVLVICFWSCKPIRRGGRMLWAIGTIKREHLWIWQEECNDDDGDSPVYNGRFYMFIVHNGLCDHHFSQQSCEGVAAAERCGFIYPGCDECNRFGRLYPLHSSNILPAESHISTVIAIIIENAFLCIDGNTGPEQSGDESGVPNLEQDISRLVVQRLKNLGGGVPDRLQLPSGTAESTRGGKQSGVPPP